MGLFTGTQQQYYSGKKEFTGDGTTTVFQISQAASAFPTGTTAVNSPIKVYINGTLIQGGLTTPASNQYSFIYTTVLFWYIDFNGGFNPYGAPANGDTITFEYNNFGNYQFLSIDNIISQFLVSYVGEGKVIPKIKRTDVIFHAKRALQELSYDTLKSCKAQEITVPASLTMILPHDYVNYTKITSVGSSGIEHIIYPTSKTSNPFNIKQDADGNYSFDIDDDTTVPIPNRDDTIDLIPEPRESDAWNNYKGNISSGNQDNYQDDTYWLAGGERYGLDPQHAQSNGSFYIDCAKGLIHFSSNLSGKTIILHYLSDSLGTDDEMVVHKFAEEAIYKWIIYAIVSTRADVPEYVVNRFRKEKFAATRKAKLRLSNIKLEELTRILRGKSKQIKH